VLVGIVVLCSLSCSLVSLLCVLCVCGVFLESYFHVWFIGDVYDCGKYGCFT
jgi:hypothetical protein